MLKTLPLKTRILFKVSGKDAPKFLKRMTTRNVETQPVAAPFLALILNSSGKILMDSIMWKLNSDSIVCEVDALLGSRFQKHLTKYAIRQDVKVEALTNWNVYAQFKSSNGSYSHDNLHTHEDIIHSSECILFDDPRTKVLGQRIWTPLNITSNASSHSIQANENYNNDLYEYYVKRSLLGIPEGYFDLLWEKSVPWESNFDVFPAVDLGFCFVGQELTARSFHTGVFRKRLLPICAVNERNQIIDYQFFNNDKIYLPKHGETIRAEGVTGRHGRMGRMGSSMGVIGLGVIKTSDAIEGTILIGEESGYRFKAIIPEWLPEMEKQRAERENIV